MHSEEQRRQWREDAKRRYWLDPEKKREAVRRWRSENPEKAAEVKREWRKRRERSMTAESGLSARVRGQLSPNY
jgi:hypothetical protein